MTPEELRQAAILLFGERGWMSRLAEGLEVDRSTVSRWFAGLPIPGPVAATLRSWLMLYRLTGRTPAELDVQARPQLAAPSAPPLRGRHRR